MRNSNSSYCFYGDISKFQEIKQNKVPTVNQSTYSRIDNKENHQVQKIDKAKLSYASKYAKKQSCDQPAKIQAPHLIDDRKILTCIFKFYASFGDRVNTSAIRSNKIIKLLSDAEILPTLITSKQVDLLFIKVNRKKPSMDLENFIIFLELLSQQVFGENLLQKFVELHLFHLYENILQFTDMGEEQTKLSQIVNFQCIQFVRAILSPLKCIYDKYFPQYFRGFSVGRNHDEFKLISATQSSLLVFLKEFEICPQFITVSSAYLLYDSILSDENIPEIAAKPSKGRFDFNSFCYYMIKLPLIIFPKCGECEDINENESQLQQIAFLFERMELSNGFAQLSAPTILNKNNWKLKVPEQVLEQIIINSKNTNFIAEKPSLKQITKQSKQTLG